MTGLYLHIPFCQKKCFYCSFVVSIGQEHRMDEYLECLSKEADHYQGRAIDTVYIGGGTPSSLNELQLKMLFDMIHRKFLIHKDSEFTIEINPESIDLSKAKLLRNLGVNRVSLGVQSLNDHILRYLGRNHDNKRALISFDVLRQAGFENINVDFMFSFPDQTIEELKEELVKMTALGSEHLSIYSLTIEEHSRFFAQKLQLADNEEQAAQYLFVVEELARNHFQQYEVSNFSKNGFGSKHNINYWTGGDYIGLGIGAHSYLEGKRHWNISKLADYLRKIEDGESVVENFEELSNERKMLETFLFGLRMNRGVDLKDLFGRFNVSFDRARQNKLNDFVNEGFLVQEDERLRATSKGMVLLDEISAHLI